MKRATRELTSRAQCAAEGGLVTQERRIKEVAEGLTKWAKDNGIDPGLIAQGCEEHLYSTVVKAECNRQLSMLGVLKDKVACIEHVMEALIEEEIKAEKKGAKRGRAKNADTNEASGTNGDGTTKEA